MLGKIVKKYKFYGVGDLCYILYINMLEKRIIMELKRKKMIGQFFLMREIWKNEVSFQVVQFKYLNLVYGFC